MLEPTAAPGGRVPIASQAIVPATAAISEVDATAQRPSVELKASASAEEERRHSAANCARVESLRRSTSPPVFQASTEDPPPSHDPAQCYAPRTSGGAHLAARIVSASTL